MPGAPANPTPLRSSGQAGIFPSPGRVSSTGSVDSAGAGPAVVGGRVPATVVGTVDGGLVEGPLATGPASPTPCWAGSPRPAAGSSCSSGCSLPSQPPPSSG